MMGWQPISSAPKNGQRFDVWVPSDLGGFRATDLRFNTSGQTLLDRWGNSANLPRWPTHWMPLPPPPQGDER